MTPPLVHWRITRDATNDEAYAILSQDPVWNCFALADLELPLRDYLRDVQRDIDRTTLSLVISLRRRHRNIYTTSQIDVLLSKTPERPGRVESGLQRRLPPEENPILGPLSCLLQRCTQPLVKLVAHPVGFSGEYHKEVLPG